MKSEWNVISEIRKDWNDCKILSYSFKIYIGNKARLNSGGILNK